MARPSNVSQGQFANRLRALLPAGWFPGAPSEGEAEQAPVLNGMLKGIASVFSWAWGQLQGAYDQQRLATATGGMLDIYAEDFFGEALPRNANESDDDYRVRIKAALFPTLGTRQSLERSLTANWEAGWRVVEPRNASDTKGYGSAASPGAGGGYGYGAADLRYGTRLSPFQGFVLLSDNPASTPPSSVLTGIEEIRAGGVVIWVGNAAP